MIARYDMEFTVEELNTLAYQLADHVNTLKDRVRVLRNLKGATAGDVADAERHVRETEALRVRVENRRHSISFSPPTSPPPQAPADWEQHWDGDPYEPEGLYDE